MDAIILEGQKVRVYANRRFVGILYDATLLDRVVSYNPKCLKKVGLKPLSVYAPYRRRLGRKVCRWLYRDALRSI